MNLPFTMDYVSLLSMTHAAEVDLTDSVECKPVVRVVTRIQLQLLTCFLVACL